MLLLEHLENLGAECEADIRQMGGLMKIMPFLAVCYMIAGFASLGLPGLSGFVAEITAPDRSGSPTNMR